jgi:hypothetical protein
MVVVPVLTVKLPVAESPAGLPVTVTEYEPATTEPTVKDPVNAPPEIEQV